MIISAALQNSVDPLVASAIAQIASGGQQFNPDHTLLEGTFGTGVMGISVTQAQALGFDATQVAQNIQAGVQYLAFLLGQFVGNYTHVIAAYATSANTVLQFSGVPPLAHVQSFVYGVSKLAAQAGSYVVSGQNAIQYQGTIDPTIPASETAAPIDPATHGTVLTQSGYNQVMSSVFPALQVDDPTLGVVPWWKDRALITGNPRIRQMVQPVTFMVYLDRNDPTKYLHAPAGQNQTTNLTPIMLQLNTSMTTFEIASKHVINRQPSRTGMHITLWGMSPDLISGTGDTGVFMNQFGITDYLSTANVPDSIKQQVRQVFFHNATTNPKAGRSALVSSLINNPEALRVAAQDAFMEFLKLFQMNGSVYYHTPNYNGLTTGLDQQSSNAWSPQVGVSSFQQHARNNDVMTRGYVSMRYRNNVYLGYFKSLNWTQDADSPFHWRFNFVFQVERTYTSLYFPTVAVTQRANITSNFIGAMNVSPSTGT